MQPNVQPGTPPHKPLQPTSGAAGDYPVSKGCTSPFAPIWNAEMVRRQGLEIARSPGSAAIHWNDGRTT